MSDPPARQFPYTVPEGALDELDSLPRLPITLHYREQRVDAIGLVDSGATVNVLPYRVGLALGASWSAQRATLRLAGNLAQVVCPAPYCVCVYCRFRARTTCVCVGTS
ncbi:MAG TPA: hypothetical protein VGB27_03645 [Candidatus Binatia bacterium]